MNEHVQRSFKLHFLFLLKDQLLTEASFSAYITLVFSDVTMC